jgi:ribosome maturation factor RimP
MTKRKANVVLKSLAEKIEDAIKPSLVDMGFELVQVKLMDGKSSQTLQIMAERPDGSMGLEDCAAISRQISAILDVEDVIATAYRLEVSSPGIDRPLVRLTDYTKYIGHQAKIETVLPVSARKRFAGVLKAVEGDTIVITVDNKEFTLPFMDIQSAKLVLTDALIKAHQAKAKAS